MEVKPLRDYILLEEVKNDSVSGIFIPEGSNLDNSQVGLILEVGQDSRLEKGLKVLYKQFGFEEITVERKKYLVGKDEHVFAILK